MSSPEDVIAEFRASGLEHYISEDGKLKPTASELFSKGPALTLDKLLLGFKAYSHFELPKQRSFVSANLASLFKGEPLLRAVAIQDICANSPSMAYYILTYIYEHDIDPCFKNIVIPANQPSITPPSEFLQTLVSELAVAKPAIEVFTEWYFSSYLGVSSGSVCIQHPHRVGTLLQAFNEASLVKLPLDTFHLLSLPTMQFSASRLISPWSRRWISHESVYKILGPQCYYLYFIDNSFKAGTSPFTKEQVTVLFKGFAKFLQTGLTSIGYSTQRGKRQTYTAATKIAPFRNQSEVDLFYYTLLNISAYFWALNRLEELGSPLSPQVSVYNNALHDLEYYTRKVEISGTRYPYPKGVLPSILKAPGLAHAPKFVAV